MHSPRRFSSIQIVAVGLFSLSQGVIGQTTTPTPAETISTPPPATPSVVVISTPAKETDVTAINAKLDSIVIPEVRLENASLEDAVSQLRTVIAKIDEASPADQQVSILLDLTAKAQMRVDNKVRLTMDLKAESLRNILGVLAKEAGLEMAVKPSGVTLLATH